MKRLPTLLLFLACLVSWQVSVAGGEPPLAPIPNLIFEAPERLHPLVDRLRQVDARNLRAAMGLVGVEHPGPPIRVILALGSSPFAQRVPTWVSGYAAGEAGIIVLLPERVPSYPYGSIESVLSHELAHVLVARAAAGGSVPRWFDEGLAMVIADRWALEDRARLVWAMVGGGQIPLGQLDSEFRRDRASAQAAYVLAKAFVRYLLHEWGEGVPSRVLALVAEDLPFPEAFAHVTGIRLHDAESAFWSKQTVWNRWVPIITSSAALWMGVTFLTLYAYRKQRQHAAVLKRQWEEEDDRA